MTDVLVRAAEPRDAPQLGQLSGALVRQHHDADPERFFRVADVTRGYASWLLRELARPRAVVLVATRSEAVVGYAYGTIEERDWARLLDDHGAIQDIFVAEGARQLGAGRALLAALVQSLESQGVRRIVLSTLVTNHAAQHLFAAAGFRPTMLEMTRSRG